MEKRQWDRRVEQALWTDLGDTEEKSGDDYRRSS